MKVCCDECGFHFTEDETLTAPNPFDPIETKEGCPACKCVECISVVCDEDGCKKKATCGYPTKDGYRMTCHDHLDASLHGLLLRLL